MRTAVSVCVLAVLVGGCGSASRDSSKDFKGEERPVAGAIEQLESAARKGDADKVCKQLLSDSLLAALRKTGTNCTTAVKEAFKDADSLDISVDDVTIHGQTASAKIKSGASDSDSRTDTINLMRAGSVWKISSLGPPASR